MILLRLKDWALLQLAAGRVQRPLESSHTYLKQWNQGIYAGQRSDLEECHYHTPGWKCRVQETGKWATMWLFVWVNWRFGLSGDCRAFLCSSSKMKKQEVTQEVNNVQKGADTKGWNLHPHRFCWHGSGPADNGHGARRTQLPHGKYFPTSRCLH